MHYLLISLLSVIVPLAGTAFVFAPINGTRSSGLSGSPGSTLRLQSLPKPPPSTFPSARRVSKFLRAATAGSLPVNQLSELHMGWGHFIMNDIMQTVPNRSDPRPIPIESDDARFAFFNVSGLEFFGSNRKEGGAFINYNTHYVDGSTIYGSTDDVALALREKVGGRLLVNGKGLPSASKLSTVPVEDLVGGKDLRASGDKRCNMAHWLSFFHTLMVMEHNYWCKTLQNRSSSQNMTDEALYQQARVRVIATIQRITFKDYLPSLLGVPLPVYTGHNSSVDSRVDQIFSATAARYGHSTVNAFARFFDPALKDLVPPVSLEDVAGNPEVHYKYGLGAVAHALSSTPISSIKPHYTEYLANRMNVNSINNNVGTDLFSIDIARGRNAGVPLYNDARELYGLSRLASISQLNAPAPITNALEQLYGDINQVELFPALLAEEVLEGASVGELMKAIYTDQFKRIRDGDQYYYVAVGTDGLGSDYTTVATTTLKSVIQRHFPNAVTKAKQNNVFFIPQETPTQAFPSATSYASSYPINENVLLEWTLDGQELCLQLSAKTDGWVGVGFNGKNGMQGLDTVMGSIDDDGNAIVYDGYSKDISIPSYDTQIGGTSDIRRVSMVKKNGIASLSFCRYLNTNDPWDAVLAGADDRIFWAYSPFTSHLSYHADKRGAVKLTLRLPTQPTPPPSHTTLIVAIVLSVVGASLIAVVIFLVRRMKIVSVVKKRLNENLELAYALAEAASNFEIDRVREMLAAATPSKMHDAFCIIVDSLEQARCNLPDTSFVPVDQPRQSISQSTRSLKEPTSGSSYVSRGSSRHGSVVQPIEPVSLKVNLQDGLRKANVACASVSVALNNPNPKIVTEIVMKIHKLLRECNGQFNFMAGDTVFCSWGSSHFTAQAEVDAIAFGHRLLRTANEQWRKEDISRELTISCAVSAGELITGRVLSLNAQLYSVYGTPANRALDLGAIAQRCHGTDVLTDTPRDIESFALRTIGYHMFEGESKPIALKEVISFMSDIDDEWMYHLREKEKTELKWQAWESTMSKILAGNWDGASDVFKEYVNENANDKIAAHWYNASLKFREATKNPSFLSQLQAVGICRPKESSKRTDH